MPTRILPVRDGEGDPYPLAGQGVQAAATTALEAAITATAAATRFGASSLAATATVTGAASVDRAAAATSTTSAVITATATVVEPTDITSLLTEGSGLYNPGGLTVPGYDQAYAVTVSDAAFDNYPTIRTPGVRVTLPLPSTPNDPHSLTITYTVSGRERRVFHDFRTRWRIDGHVIEPDPLGVSTVCYTWDTTDHVWYVSSTTGDVTDRQHGPDENPDGVPLFFSPECRALATFDDIKAAHISALTALPPTTIAAMREAGQAADVVGTASGYMFESMLAREVFDPVWDSGISGRYDDPFAAAYAWMSGQPVDGRTMLHELGHTWDKWALPSLGLDYGVNPVSGCNVANRTDTTYHPDGITPETITVWTPTNITVGYYDESGTQYDELSFARSQTGALNEEAPLVALYATVPDPSGDYYRSNILEWVAQSLMLAWVDHAPGYNSSQRDSLISAVGGAAIFADFVDYCVEVGALPSSW